MPGYLRSKKNGAWYLGRIKIGQGYLGGTLVYQSAFNVTYVVDTGVEYTEKVKPNASMLSPTTFTPAKSGWEFAGWRRDTEASGDVLTSAVATGHTTLYAVFKQAITLSYSGNGATSGSTESQSGTRYYNNGSISNPSFSLRSNGFSKSWYNFSQWAMGSTSGTKYNAGASVTLTSSTTFYAIWSAAYSARTCNITDLVDVTANISSYTVLGSSLTESGSDRCVRSNGSSGNAIEFTGSNGAQIIAKCPCTVTVTYNFDLYAWDGADDWYIWRAHAYKNSSSVQELFYRGGQKSGGGFFASGASSCTVSLNAGDTFSIRIIGGGSQSGTPTGNRSRFSGTVSFVGTPTI